MIDTIGVVGLGYVGTAVSTVMSTVFKVETYDKYKQGSCDSLEQLVEKAKVIFVCVPTPMKETGSCDISIVESVVSDINEMSDGHVVVIKSTVPPMTTQIFNDKYTRLTSVFSPEFLTESNYIKDFEDCNRVIIGGPRRATTIVKNIFLKRFPKKTIVKTGSTYAEMVKYVTNTFLATKVMFANEMKQVCESLEIDYDKVIEYSRYDERLGHTHWSVPGPDGKSGFGGSCFPKDINALMFFCGEMGVDSSILKSVWDKNLQVRPERDWESLIGRAVIKEYKNE
tara:strand:- start:19 stop:867 length:849 start_codon:yes stop_codon:yes gene_type:complete